ncbi:kinase-like domain-containing protein [Panaeolus papilionaceus]|nr:kinase-like domain-containing protein [Panaeolus papilionaceus]
MVSKVCSPYDRYIFYPLQFDRTSIMGVFKSLFVWFRRRIILPLLQWNGSLWYPHRGKPWEKDPQRLTKRLRLKIIPEQTRFTEANTMKFVQENTSIPTPMLLDAWSDDHGTYMLMQWIEGETLQNRWETLSAKDKLRIATQIRGYVDQLRAFERPLVEASRIGPIDGSQLWDENVHVDPQGPFSSEKEFNDFMLSRLSWFLDGPTAASSQNLEIIRQKTQNDHRIVLTHSDLHSRNILINENADVVGIIDWGMSAWMPEYWEFVTCVNGSPLISDWEDYAPIFTHEDRTQLESLLNIALSYDPINTKSEQQCCPISTSVDPFFWDLSAAAGKLLTSRATPASLVWRHCTPSSPIRPRHPQSNPGNSILDSH